MACYIRKNEIIFKNYGMLVLRDFKLICYNFFSCANFITFYLYLLVQCNMNYKVYEKHINLLMQHQK